MNERVRNVQSLPLIFITILLIVLSNVYIVHANDSITLGFDPDPGPSPPSPPLPPSPPPSAPPSNPPPVANITGPLVGYVNQTLFFSARYSFDPDGFIVGYRWDFENDGLFDTPWLKDVLITHNYTTPGNYTVKLQVQDNDGAITTCSFWVTILQLRPPLHLPVARVNGPYSGFTNENISFNSTGSYDSDDTIIKYWWDFGDGNTSSLENPVHKYTQPGNYTVLLTVTDNDNLSVTAVTSVYIRGRQESVPSGDTGPAPLPPERIISLFIAALIMFMLTSGIAISFKQKQKQRLAQKERVAEMTKSIVTDILPEKKTPSTASTTSTIQESPAGVQTQKKRITDNPIGESIFLEGTDEKLGDISEAIYDEGKQIIGYKVKENKSEKVLHLFAEQCIQKKNTYIYTPEYYTIPSKAIDVLELYDNVNPDILLLLKDNILSRERWYKIYIQQDDELRKNINHAYALDKMIKDSLHVLKKQHIIVEDKLKELQLKKVENEVSPEQYIQMTLQYHQMLERIDQNIKKYQDIAERLTHTSSGRLSKL